jgi:hypothetical protein
MTFNLEINKPEPLKLVVYGDSGVGKSTFASKAPNPIFIDLNGNDNLIFLGVDSWRPDNIYGGGIDLCDSIWDFLFRIISCEEDAALPQTLVIDSLYGLINHVFMSQVIAEIGVEGLGGVCGKGYKLVDKIFSEFLETIEYIRKRKGLHIIFICGAEKIRINSIELGSYDFYDMSFGTSHFDKGLTDKLKNWSNVILHLTTSFRGTRNDSLGKYIMETTTTPTSLTTCAKNPYGLDKILPTDWNLFSSKIKELFEDRKRKKQLKLVD